MVLFLEVTTETSLEAFFYSMHKSSFVSRANITVKLLMAHFTAEYRSSDNCQDLLLWVVATFTFLHAREGRYERYIVLLFF